MNFEFITPQKIIFGEGTASKLAVEILRIGEFPLILHGNSLKKSGRLDAILSGLSVIKNSPVTYAVPSGEPSPDIIGMITKFSREKGVDCIISIGGGSVIDTGKVVAALAVNDGNIEDYLEGVGTGRTVINDPLPFIAAPTTAGSGAEATKNSVISDINKKYKKSFRDDRLLARTVIADPELTMDLPWKETSSGGMDAICQLVESFVTKKKNDFCMALSAFFIPGAVKALPDLMTSPADMNLRTVMMKSSLASGIALANSGLGAAHGFASGIGGMYDIPHGLVCAILLPHIIKLNSDHDNGLYGGLANVLNTDKTGVIDLFYNLNLELGIPENFSSFGIDKSNAYEITERSQGGSMKGNPIDLSIDKWTDFISKLL